MIKSHKPEWPQNGMDYVFSHFTGILLCSIFYFLLYCIYNRNKPHVFPQSVLPGFLSGIMWAIAQTSWFVANDTLGLVVSYPLISAGPGIVANLWGILLFKEITGKRNYLIFLSASLLSAVAIACITISKEYEPPKNTTFVQ
eukprot:TRINITY_DN2406_c0_g1_i2.p1 TRINITY_DN2406_c0_g1~~TRINITY_DN2406_c0_g1_i2.p1  ORF type:complete len:142 (+),score=16.48 TRINITY_DN2406_c0_g1_i2:647-1072(+)